MLIPVDIDMSTNNMTSFNGVVPNTLENCPADIEPISITKTDSFIWHSMKGPGGITVDVLGMVPGHRKSDIAIAPDAWKWYFAHMQTGILPANDVVCCLDHPTKIVKGYSVWARHSNTTQSKHLHVKWQGSRLVICGKHQKNPGYRDLFWVKPPKKAVTTKSRCADHTQATHQTGDADSYRRTHFVAATPIGSVKSGAAQ